MRGEGDSDLYNDEQYGEHVSIVLNLWFTY